MLESILYGVHTYSVGMVLTYRQFKKIQEACYETGCVQDTSNIWEVKEQLYCNAYHNQGIKVFLHGIFGELYQLRVRIEPCCVRLGMRSQLICFSLISGVIGKWLSPSISC